MGPRRAPESNLSLRGSSPLVGRFKASPHALFRPSEACSRHGAQLGVVAMCLGGAMLNIYRYMISSRYLEACLVRLHRLVVFGFSVS